MGKIEGSWPMQEVQKAVFKANEPSLCVPRLGAGFQGQSTVIGPEALQRLRPAPKPLVELCTTAAIADD